MKNTDVTTSLINMILKAESADENDLRLARKTLIKILEKVGAKTFVTTTAEILKNNFRIQGCNDARIPLKRIFSISLEELEENLTNHKYNLSEEHPINLLSADHKDSIKKLKALRFSLGRLNLNQDTPANQIKDKLKQAKDYYVELDSHIKKEEEVLFPALERNGMQEHPQNLREEHKGFRENLSKIIESIKGLQKDKRESVIEEIRKVKEKFISDISNHIFREAYVFYPASLEFIAQGSQWDKIKEGFKTIK